MKDDFAERLGHCIRSCIELAAEVNRAFSAGGFFNFMNPGALPQVRHGESVLWRTNNEKAPSALRNLGSCPQASDETAPLALRNPGALHQALA